MTKLIQGTEQHGIATIDGIFVPYTDHVDEVGIRGGLATVTTYWGVGYDSLTDARIAVSRTKHGRDIPPGQHVVDMHTGEEIMP